MAVRLILELTGIVNRKPWPKYLIPSGWLKPSKAQMYLCMYVRTHIGSYVCTYSGNNTITLGKHPKLLLGVLPGRGVM